MKRFILLLFTLIYTISGFAQIEEMNEDEFLKKPIINEVPKDYFFEPYNGQVVITNKFWVEDATNRGDKPSVEYTPWLVDIRGKQLLGVNRIPDAFSTSPYKYIITSKEEYFILSSNELQTSFYLERFRPGNYYEYVDIIITKNEIESLKQKLVEDSIVIDEVQEGFNRYIPEVKDVRSAIFRWKNFSGESVPNGWPEHIIKDKGLPTAIFVLRGKSDNRLYYIPYRPRYLGGCISSNYYLVNLRNFICEEAVHRLKTKYEGKRVVDWRKKEYILQKIALKDGMILCAITDTASVEVKYNPLFDERKVCYNYWHRNDSVDVLGMEDETWYCLKSDVDSIETAIEIRKLEEQRKNLQKDEQKKKMLVSKYGEKIANSIIKGKACVGMNTQMVEEVLGKTDSKMKSTSALGTIEIWTYSFMHELYPLLYPITIVTFTNGKVSEVEEVK